MDKKEQIEKAIEILTNHNKWRLGADTPHTEPKDLTFAIDTVIDALSQPKEVEPTISKTEKVDLDWILNSFGNELIRLGSRGQNSNAVCELANKYIKDLPHLQKLVLTDGEIELLINDCRWYDGTPNGLTLLTKHIRDRFLQKPVESDAVEFAVWKDKEFPCKWMDTYGKYNSKEWFTITQLYEQFKQPKK